MEPLFQKGGVKAMKKSHTFSTKLDSGEKVQLTIEFDFSGVEESQIIDWALSNRVIAFQRVLRTLSKEEAEKLNNSTIHALECGKKIESKSEKIQKLVAAGIPRKIAELAVENPEALKNLNV